MTLTELPDHELEPIRDALTNGITVKTSGSTARPKRVRLRGSALISSARATSDEIGEGGWVLALPLTYIAGIMVVVRSLVAETPLVDARREPFDVREFATLAASLADGIWFTALVPAQLVRLVDLAEGDTDARDALRRFSRILVGGQAIPSGLIDRATALGIRVTKTYGSAETAGGVVYDGRPIGDTRVRIAENGRVIIATSSLADEYLGDTELTATSFRVDDGTRWWHTTDAGELTDDELVILGRMDDVIITGGIKVSLGDIDRVLESAGIDAVASWFTDGTWGQVPALVSTSNLDREVVRDLIERELSKAARPYRFVTVLELPRLSSGKIDRRALNELVAGDES
ncbi:MAG: AMP-binding protein [Microbacteriaceae bacterium]|nr:AMP-binding protein [Microbacteriaceae bacterium]